MASTIAQANGTRAVDLQVLPALDVVKNATPYVGTSSVAGREYVVHIDPIIDEQHAVIGALWYGIPIVVKAAR